MDDRVRGMLGKVLAFYGVIETQARGGLHFHMICWTELKPSLVQKISHLHELSTIVATILDSQLTAQLPIDIHSTRLFNLHEKVKPNSHHMNMNIPLNTLTDFRHHAMNVIARTGMHSHSHTCSKGKSMLCRMSRPSDTHAERAHVLARDYEQAFVVCVG